MAGAKRLGRPPTMPDRKRHTFWLSSKQAALIAAWQRAHACSASEAVRQMIEHCKETKA